MAKSYTKFLKYIGNDHGYKSVLCLNGDLPEAAFLSSLDLPIVMADGASHIIHGSDISPYAIIGDFDSIDTNLFGSHNLVHAPDQSTSDFQKAIAFLEENALLPTIVLGANGGYMDHILNNINILCNGNHTFFAPPIVGHFIDEQTSIKINTPLNTKISILGTPVANVTTQGLKWNMKNDEISFFGNNSCFNRSINPEINISVSYGKAMVILYLEDVIDAGC